MYRKVRFIKSEIGSVEKFDGETIEQKMERILDNQEPITDGAPEIFTERKDGVIAAYNIRTDRWEIAAEAMDRVSGSIDARRDNMALVKDEPEVKLDESSTGTDGKSEA